MADRTDTQPTAPARRRRTRVWEDELDGWCFEVTHPDGHSATGAHLADKQAAAAAAKKVTFASAPGPDATPPGA